MTFSSFLLQLGWNLLAYILPFCAVVYVAVRYGIRHGFADIAKAQKPRNVRALTGTDHE